MKSEGIVKDNSAPRVVESLVKEPTEEELVEINALPAIDISVEQS